MLKVIVPVVKKRGMMNLKKSVLRVAMRKLKKEMSDSCLRDFELVSKEERGQNGILCIFFPNDFF